MRPGARAEVDHEVERARAGSGQHGLLDVGFRIVQRAQAGPSRRRRGEVLSRRLRPARPSPRRSRSRVAADVRRHRDRWRRSSVSTRPAPAPLRASGRTPSAFRQAFDQPGARSEFQVPRQARLALVQDLRQVRRPKARHGPGAQEIGPASPHRRREAAGRERTALRIPYKRINISLYDLQVRRDCSGRFVALEMLAS